MNVRPLAHVRGGDAVSFGDGHEPPQPTKDARDETSSKVARAIVFIGKSPASHWIVSLRGAAVPAEW